MKTRTRYVVAVALTLSFVGAGIWLYLVLMGPRMRTQESIREYEREMPMPPSGSVPVEPVDLILLSRETRPVVLSDENLRRGGVYYGYYCVFCHGENGDGDAPVGHSYMPKPASLTSRRVQSFSDEELLRASLFGTGHEPVLPVVVAPEHRPYLVLYVRSLSGQ